MYNELFGKEDYEITLDEFKREMDKALQTLIGKDVMKNGGIGKLVKDATENVLFGCIECDNTIIKDFCPEINDYMAEFGRVKWTYKPDRRKISGVGTVIESIRFEYTHPHLAEIAEHVCDISQVLTYDTAKARRDECNARIAKLNEELITLKAFADSYTEIMRVEKYF